MSRIMRKYEKYKNYKYLQVINKSKDFDKKYKKWLSSMAWGVPKAPTKMMKTTKPTILTTNKKMLSAMV